MSYLLSVSTNQKVRMKSEPIGAHKNASCLFTLTASPLVKTEGLHQQSRKAGLQDGLPPDSVHVHQSGKLLGKQNSHHPKHRLPGVLPGARRPKCRLRI